MSFALTAPSTIRFSDISIYSGSLISLGLNSILDATGMGYKNGPGFVDPTLGASFAAQSAFCDQQKSVPINSTYSTYYQDPEAANKSSQYGSGAGTITTIGGGRIMLSD